MKARAIAALLILGTVTAVTAHAADEYNTGTGLTAAGAPLGLHGVDPVAFIDIGNRIDGTALYAAVHDGVAYYFSTEANQQAFEASPERYVPQFGGFCAFGVSVGKKFDGDPRYAAIEDGRLYVFLNEAVFHEFQKDRAGTIARAEENWRRIRSTSIASL